ncbi:PREDICTED: heterogeneous nuclear ribonucleoprotein U-like protein 1, partial [Acropora digitifera]|uniref:heterogeneous nuclear ribonucleoprotein U-like protein 1 n=1 Tax=Acropora digitifera TaxID=70779 RepID=UPI00077A37CF
MSDLDEAGVKKLKVAELRAELQSRGLDSKGNKPVLVDRLLEAISNSTVTEANGGEVVQEVAEQPQEEAENIEEGSPDEEIQAKSEEPAKEEGDDANQEEETTSETVESVGVASESVEAPAPEPVSQVMEEEPSEKHEEMQSETTPTPTEEKIAENEENDKKTQEGEPMETSQDGTTTSQEATEEGKGDKTDKEKDVDDEDIEIVPDASRNESAEEETPLDDSLVVLDKYNCDLHLKVAPDGLSGKPLADEGFSYLLAGARATWGTTKGKVCFECKVTSFISVELPESEEPKNVVRVGWSTDSESLQLGEVKMSYGYDSSGKKALDAEFTEYGQSFGVDDVIGCYLDLESDPKTVSFTKNGEDMGLAFEFTEELSNQALFPHVLIKNAEFVVNFGSQEEPWFPPKEGYTFMQSVGEDSLVHGTRGPANKKDCEVIMMVGLPASGKTSWVNKQVLDNLEKKYNVLGTNSIMEKMKVFGVARKRDVGGYSKLMDKAAKCLHRLFELAPTKTRNYILDQTNVYLSAQKKKIRPFEGFIRRAIVCIPTQEELKTRTEDRKKEGIELPENAVSDMKTNCFNCFFVFLFFFFCLKVTSFISVELPESEEPKNVVRVGWSTDSESLQLGEVKMSYGYDSSGKKALDAEFTEYGQSFGVDDVIGCYLDLESDPKTVSFTKNGEDMGAAFEFTEELSNQALFPHVLIKNAEFVVNFGSQEEPWFPPKEGYTFMQSVGEDSLVHGTRGPASKKDCEVIMMVGLPASGKTSWVNKQVLDNLEKKYNVLGTNSIMEKMKVFGVARKRDVGGYSKLMDKAAKCLHRLFELAPTKTRNYILDQTNVYLSAQKKKIRPFEGFIRRAIVCIPTQEELKTRTEDRKKEGIELPENAVSDMKMSFTLPKVGEFFEEVIYADQPENKAKTIVDEYIKEGRSYRSRSSSGPEPPFKRSRFDDRPRHGGGYNRNRSYEDRGGY